MPLTRLKKDNDKSILSTIRKGWQDAKFNARHPLEKNKNVRKASKAARTKKYNKAVKYLGLPD